MKSEFPPPGLKLLFWLGRADLAGHSEVARLTGQLCPPPRPKAARSLCDPLTSKGWVGSGGGEGFLFMVTSSRIPSLQDSSGGVPDIPIHRTVSSHTYTHSLSSWIPSSLLQFLRLLPLCVSVTLTLSMYKRQEEHPSDLSRQKAYSTSPWARIASTNTMIINRSRWAWQAQLITSRSRCQRIC